MQFTNTPRKLSAGWLLLSLLVFLLTSTGSALADAGGWPTATPTPLPSPTATPLPTNTPVILPSATATNSGLILFPENAYVPPANAPINEPEPKPNNTYLLIMFWGILAALLFIGIYLAFWILRQNRQDDIPPVE